VSYRNAQLAQQ